MVLGANSVGAVLDSKADQRAAEMAAAMDFTAEKLAPLKFRLAQMIEIQNISVKSVGRKIKLKIHGQ